MTLKQQIDSLFQLYGLRNAMYHRGDIRLLFLFNAVRALGKLDRKEVTDTEVLGRALASVFSRACAYADSFIDLPIIEALSEKYPKGHCAYCHSPECTCDANRKTDIVYASTSVEQASWSIAEWCANLDAVYGKVNRERGVEFAIRRLNEEVVEVVDAQLWDSHNPAISLREVRQIMAREFADVFAWIFTLAVLFRVDLGAVLQSRYFKCTRCNLRPCDCGPVYMPRPLPNTAHLVSANSTVAR